MTTPTSNIVNTAHNIHNNVRSTTLPHVDCYSRLRASPPVSSELGYRPTRCRDAHQAVSLPQKGWVGLLPAYRQCITYNLLWSVNRLWVRLVVRRRIGGDAAGHRRDVAASTPSPCRRRTAGGRRHWPRPWRPPAGGGGGGGPRRRRSSRCDRRPTRRRRGRRGCVGWDSRTSAGWRQRRDRPHDARQLRRRAYSSTIALGCSQRPLWPTADIASDVKYLNTWIYK